MKIKIMKTLVSRSKHIKNGTLLVITLLCFYACEKNKLEYFSPSSIISINDPDDVEIVSRAYDSLQFTNLSTGQVSNFSIDEDINLIDGLYDCSYYGKVYYKNDTIIAEGDLKGAVESVVINGDTTSISIDTYLFAESDDFIFEEIYFTGTLRTSGRQYYGDQYIKIYNNTDHVLYADGVAFCESKFLSVRKCDYTPDIQADTFTIDAIYIVPGSGKDHPVKPGESFVICDTGIDHKTVCSNSFDLSDSDYEWYDVSTSPTHLDIDSETVPNLNKWYCYTLSFFIMHNRGFNSYALARVPSDITKEQYLVDYYYTYDYILYTDVGNYEMSNSAYKLPNSWIIDGVNCSVEAEREWNLLPPTIDAGWTHCGTVDHDKTRYFQSVRRKMLYLSEDSIRVLKDTNNSCDDFNTECVPSIIEEQGTSIDADGTKATTVTYDGVQEVE